MTVQAISFGSKAVTKKGNIYDKSKIGGYTGMAAGALYAGYNAAKIVKVMKNTPKMVYTLKDVYKQLPDKLTKVISFKDYVKSSIKNAKKLSVVAGVFSAAVLILSGFGLGKAVDAIINKKRAVNADNAAFAKTETKPETKE